MKTSRIGVELIKKFEGLRLVAYKPVATEKYYTIGYGHYGADVKAGMQITEQQAEEYLKRDLVKFENSLNALKLNVNQNQFDALISFIYNVGFGNFQRSILLKKVQINPRDISIKNEFMRWTYSGNKKLVGLERRRKAEADLYFSN